MEDNKIIEKLYIENYSNLIAYCCSLTKSHDEAEDIVHDVFLKIRNVDGLGSLVNPSGYLKTAAKNMLLDKKKHAKVVEEKEKIVQVIYEESLSSVFYSPEHTAISRERNAVVWKAIKSIPKRSRNAFLMHRLNNVNQNQIASNEGVTVHCVQKHAKRAKDRCRKFIENHYSEYAK